MWVVVGESPVTGLPVKVSFNGAGLVANKDVRLLLEDYAATWGSVGVTPVGPYLVADLTNESSAFLLTCTVLMRAELVAGETPPLPELPDLPANSVE